MASTLSTANDARNFARHARSGRPLGDEAFLDIAEMLVGCDLKKQTPRRGVADPVVSIVSPYFFIFF